MTIASMIDDVKEQLIATQANTRIDISSEALGSVVGWIDYQYPQGIHHPDQSPYTQWDARMDCTLGEALTGHHDYMGISGKPLPEGHDPIGGFVLLTKAAMGDSIRAQIRLAEMYGYGRIGNLKIARDPGMASYWYSRASETLAKQAALPVERRGEYA